MKKYELKILWGSVKVDNDPSYDYYYIPWRYYEVAYGHCYDRGDYSFGFVEDDVKGARHKVRAHEYKFIFNLNI